MTVGVPGFDTLHSRDSVTHTGIRLFLGDFATIFENILGHESSQNIVTLSLKNCRWY
jgi:hypothetical protein